MKRDSANQSTDVTGSVIEMLEGVHRAFHQEPNAASDVERERERYAAALISVAKFFDQIECYKEGARFFELSSAIADLNAGVRLALLTPVNTETRPPDTSSEWRAKASVVVAAEALIACGGQLKQVLVEISKDLKVPTNTLANWRKEFRQDRIGNAQARDLFVAGRDLIEAIKGDPTHLR